MINLLPILKTGFPSWDFYYLAFIDFSPLQPNVINWLFDPVDLENPTTTPLGFYPPYLILNSGIQIKTGENGC